MPETRKVLLEYPGSRHYYHEYFLTDYHCMKCGEKTLWQENGPGDYYLENTMYCSNCYHSSHSVAIPTEVTQKCHLDEIAQIVKNECYKPTTPKGG